MSTLFSGLAALCYGAGDFLGGAATRYSRVYGVLFWSQLAGLLVAAVAAPIVGYSSFSLTDVMWGAAAGLGGAWGLLFLYHGIAHTTAAVISPVAAVVGAALPVVFGVAIGERPEPLRWIGVAIALSAVFFLTRKHDESQADIAKALKLGAIAGIGFSAFFICISRVNESSGILPLLITRASSLLSVFIVTKASKRSLRIERTSRLSTACAGALDMFANVFYLTATRFGMLSLATAVAALYPGPTVILARIVYKERLGLSRIVGLVFAICGVALISIG